MVKAADNVLGCIGNTPLVRSHSLAADLEANVYLKLEYMNPGGSVKDRPALQIILDAEASGELQPGGTIVEATSGNTGVGLAMAAAIKGYQCIFVMPDKMSEEKIKGLRAFGAKVVVCPTAVEPEDPRSYYQVADRLFRETPGAFLANQYHNPSNPRGHYVSTGPEIWEQFEGELDVFVTTLGTGGTMSGTAKYLKEQNPNLIAVGVDPLGSVYYDYFKTGKLVEANTYLVEGFGEDFLPSTMNFEFVDDVVRVADKECFIATRRLVREEGIYAGGSSGAAVAGTIKWCAKHDKKLNVCVILPDGASKYLSKIFDDDWMRENGFLDTDPLGGTTVGDLIGKRPKKVITADASLPVGEAIQLMKRHGFSQLPVLDDGRVVGLINESDVLNHLLESGAQSDAIAGLVEHQFAIVEPSNRIGLLGQFFKQNKVVIVVEGKELVGIVTKIDFIDFVSRRM